MKTLDFLFPVQDIHFEKILENRELDYDKCEKIISPQKKYENTIISLFFIILSWIITSIPFFTENIGNAFLFLYSLPFIILVILQIVFLKRIQKNSFLLLLFILLPLQMMLLNMSFVFIVGIPTMKNMNIYCFFWIAILVLFIFTCFLYRVNYKKKFKESAERQAIRFSYNLSKNSSDFPTTKKSKSPFLFFIPYFVGIIIVRIFTNNIIGSLFAVTAIVGCYFISYVISFSLYFEQEITILKKELYETN